MVFRRLMRPVGATAAMIRRVKCACGPAVVVAGEAREARQGYADCSTVDGDAALGSCKPSASIASRSRGFLSSDWPRNDGLWLLQWRRHDRETNRCSGGEMIARNPNEAGLGLISKTLKREGR